jgi:hypothetical protein
MMKVPLILLLAVAAGVPSGPGADDPPPPAAIEAAGLRQLLTIRRVYVDRLTGGETAAQMRDILISSLEGAKLFILTENQITWLRSACRSPCQLHRRRSLVPPADSAAGPCRGVVGSHRLEPLPKPFVVTELPAIPC